MRKMVAMSPVTHRWAPRPPCRAELVRMTVGRSVADSCLCCGCGVFGCLHTSRFDPPRLRREEG